MDTPHTKINDSFLARWMLVNIIGLPVLLIPYNIGFFIMAGFAIVSDGGATESMAYRAVGIGLVVLAFTGAIIGAWLGFLQWLVLRQRLPQAGGWITATAIGAALGAPLGALLYAFIFAVFVDRPDGANFTFAYEYLAFGPALGLVIGAFQGSQLRRGVNQTKWWIIGLPVLITTGMLFAKINRITSIFILLIHGLIQSLKVLFPTINNLQVFFVFEVFTSLAALLAVSLLTGILLDWLLITHKKQEVTR